MQAVEKLLKKSANVDQADHNGATPLSMALGTSTLIYRKLAAHKESVSIFHRDTTAAAEAAVAAVCPSSGSRRGACTPACMHGGAVTPTHAGACMHGGPATPTHAGACMHGGPATHKDAGACMHGGPATHTHAGAERGATPDVLHQVLGGAARRRFRVVQCRNCARRWLRCCT
jgi:hypothetical protein